MTYDDLTLPQQRLYDEVWAQPTLYGSDLRDRLVTANGRPEDKAAVAQVWGAPGAGEEFLR